MPCIFCIAALAVVAATLLPALLDTMQADLAALAPDLVRRIDTESAIGWRGSFAFTAVDGSRRVAAADVTVYKQSKRARIQVQTHELPRADVERLEDTIARAIGATIVSRHDAHAVEVIGELAGHDAVLEPPQPPQPQVRRQAERPL